MRRTALVLCLGLGLALADDYEVDCGTLRMGQYICPDPDVNHIDPQTQQPRNCTRENKALGTFQPPLVCRKFVLMLFDLPVNGTLTGRSILCVRCLYICCQSLTQPTAFFTATKRVLMLD